MSWSRDIGQIRRFLVPPTAIESFSRSYSRLLTLQVRFLARLETLPLLPSSGIGRSGTLSLEKLQNVTLKSGHIPGVFSNLNISSYLAGRTVAVDRSRTATAGTKLSGCFCPCIPVNELWLPSLGAPPGLVCAQKDRGCEGT